MDNNIWEEEESTNWDVIEISKVSDKNIRILIDNLKLDKAELSDDFFISFESLLKIGNRAESILNFYIQQTNEIHNFKVEIFNFLLDFIKNNSVKHVLVPQLYHTDFITRARTIFRIEEAGDKSYLKFLIPLLNDPDDSVRWAVIRFLNSNNLLKNPLIYKELKNLIEKESNLIIKEKLKVIFKNSRDNFS
jgi:hypothetical protein